MHSLCTAIIYLREPVNSGVVTMIAPMLRLLRGVLDYEFEPNESLISVRFNRMETGLAEIVRAIEDAGSTVSSVAQRTAA